MRQSVLIVLVCFSLLGCGTLRSGALKLSKENIANFATADEVMKDFVKVWPQISGAFDGAREVLPANIMRDKDKIDELVGGGPTGDETEGPPPEPPKLTKKTRAEIGIRFTLLTDKFAVMVYKQFAPQILQLLAVFGL